MITNNTLSEIGDVLMIYSQAIVNASISISSYSDNLFGVTGTRFFKKQFKYSLDGLIYSDWIELTDLNLQQINGIVNGLLYFEFRYERVGTDTAGILEFNGIELIGSIELQICENTATLESIFAELVNNDFYTIYTRNNILRKIYYNGILPKFIERGEQYDNVDFISFWSAVCIYLSYFSSFANNFDNIIFKREYLAEYLRQNNIEINEKETTYQHLYYICTNFYDQIRRRGTQMTFKKFEEILLDGSVIEADGEWLRLICKRDYEEFLLEVIKKENSGFCLGKSSPIYNGTYFSTQLNKTEENTEDFVDLSKYDLIGNPTINTNDFKECLTIASENAGLGLNLTTPPVAVDVKKLITIDEEIDYELTFNFKRNGDSSITNLKVGILGYNKNGIILLNCTKRIEDNINSNLILNENLISISKIDDQWYSFRGILYSKFTVNVEDGRTNLNKGSNLKINDSNSQKIEKIKLCIYTEDSLGTYELFIHNFKFRPLVRGKNILNKFKGEYNDNGAKIFIKPSIKNPQFLQSNIFCLNYRTNNNQEKNNNQVDNFIQNYLLPYQQKIVSIPLNDDSYDITEDEKLLWRPIDSICLTDTELWRGIDPICIQDTVLWRPIEPECIQDTVLWRPIEPECVQDTVLWRGIEPECVQDTVLWRGIDPICIQEESANYCVSWSAQNEGNIKMSTTGYIDFTAMLAGRVILPVPTSVGTITGYVVVGPGAGTYSCSIPMTFTSSKAEWDDDTLPVITDNVLTSLIYSVEISFDDASEYSIVDGQTNAVVIPGGQMTSTYNSCIPDPGTLYSYKRDGTQGEPGFHTPYIEYIDIYGDPQTFYADPESDACGSFYASSITNIYFCVPC